MVLADYTHDKLSLLRPQHLLPLQHHPHPLLRHAPAMRPPLLPVQPRVQQHRNQHRDSQINRHPHLPHTIPHLHHQRRGPALARPMAPAPSLVA